MLFLSLGPVNREHATPLEHFMPSHRNSLFLILSRLLVQANGKVPVLHNMEKESLAVTEHSLFLSLSLSPSPSLALTKLSLCYCYAFPSLFNWLSFSPDGICRLLFYDVLKRDSTKWIKNVNLTVLQSCKKVRILKFYLQILFKYNNSWCLT